MSNDAGNFKIVPFVVESSVQVIAGQGTFNLLAVEELYRAIATGAPACQFGIAFSEGSDNRMLRTTGNDDTLMGQAARILGELNAGHYFIVLMRDAFPLQVLNNVKSLATTVNVQVASGNDISAIVADLPGVSAVLGFTDGLGPSRPESTQERSRRRDAVRRIGYLEPG